jgi:D-glycero-alpha-D-manno-heptose-7-phosphate kinase
VSLVGGSTDIQKYLNEYKTGSVISFASTLYTYIILKEIHRGFEHNIVYADVKEKIDCRTPSKIKNDIVRAVFTHFDVPAVEVIFTADIPSSGSGLASSSSYLINLIEAVTKLLKIKLSQFEICKLAIDLERTFNPLTGYQDAYGCGLGALKKLEFSAKGLEAIKFLDAKEFRNLPMYLCPTNQLRSSTSILHTLDIAQIDTLKPWVDFMEKHITSKDNIRHAINFSWKQKKKTSPEIITPELESIEKTLWENGAEAVKLLGAGGGGYFFIIADRPRENAMWRPIEIDYTGVTSIQV